VGAVIEDDQVILVTRDTQNKGDPKVTVYEVKGLKGSSRGARKGQLLNIVKMRVISKMNSHYKLNHHEQMRRDLNQVEGKLLVMLINFIWMKICCFRLVCNFVFPYLHY
jgi:hypothetical protein